MSGIKITRRNDNNEQQEAVKQLYDKKIEKIISKMPRKLRFEEKVNSIPKLLETEYAKGKKDVTNELEKNNKFETELLKKDFQNTIDRQNDKIVSLQEEMNRVSAEKDSLQQKLDQAYIQIKDMATKTVEATGGVKILGNNNNDANK